MSSAGKRILKSVRKARAYARGEVAEGFVAHVPGEVDVRAIRAGLDLSQDAFAARFGFSAAAVRDWEQGRRRPEAAARVLLLVIAREPEAVLRALAARPRSPATARRTGPHFSRIRERSRASTRCLPSV